MEQQYHRVVLSSPVEGLPRADNFQLVSAPLPKPRAGQCLVRHIYLSLDPYQRPAMAGRHLTADKPLGIGDMPPGETVGQVVESRHPEFKEGDYVRHLGGWQEYSLSDGSDTYRVDPAQAPLSTYLGILGMPGLTAYASMVQLADVRRNHDVLVSAASGPVGSMVGQIAILKGARAWGIAGTDEKCRFVTEELGFEACVNYRANDYPQSLRTMLPDGADIYHDNVGGQMLMDALLALKNYGTVILCGLMSQYSDPGAVTGFNLGLPIMKRAVMKGLVVFDFENRRQEFFDLVAPWVRDGAIRYKEDRADGIEHAGEQFARLMRGQNFGKSLVVLGPE